MANTITIDLEWENDVNFKMTSKLNVENKVTVISCDENQHLPKVWKDVESICKKFFDAKLQEIGEEMKR